MEIKFLSFYEHPFLSSVVKNAVLELMKGQNNDRVLKFIQIKPITIFWMDDFIPLLES